MAVSHKTGSKKTATESRTSGESAATRPRQLRLPPYRPMRLRPLVRHPARLPNVLQLSKQTAKNLWELKRVLLGILLVYAVLTFILVRGIGGGTDVNALKQQFRSVLGGNMNQIVLGLSVYTALLTSTGSNGTPASGVYQILLGIIISLAVIWALRQLATGQRVKLKDTFYKGEYPLVPFILVLLVIMLQTLPFLIGGILYVLTVVNGVAVLGIEKVLWSLLFFALAFVSIYMLCSSVFALYIVTLPDMTPFQALKNARKLVQYRRLSVFRKLLFLPVGLLFLLTIIMLPSIILAASLAQWVFLFLTMCMLIITHAYMYNLYRELVK